MITRRPLLFLLIGIVIISFSPILVRYSDASALQAGFYRNAFGILLLLPMVLIRRDAWHCGKWTVLLPCIAGVLFFVDLWGWHVAIGYIGPGMATLFGNFQVFFVTFFGIVFLGERPPLRFIFAVPLALLGVYLISQSGDGDGSRLVEGVLLCLMAALCYSVFLMLNRKSQSLPQKISPHMNMVYITLCTGLLFGAAIGLSPSASFHLDTQRAFWSLLVYGLFPHVLGWIIIIRCLPLIKASVAGISLLLQPVLTFVWEVLFWDRQFQALQLAGGTLAIVAIYLGTVKRTPREKGA